MDENPYLDPHADDDIFTSSTKPPRPKGRHNFDGTPCPRCNGRVHNVSMPKDVPEVIIDQLSELLDHAPDGVVADQIIVTAATPNQHLVVDEFLGFIREVNSLNQSGPLIRVLAELLDDMTAGEVTRRWKVYNAERELLIAHTVLKTINSIVEGMKAMNEAANKDVSSVVEMCDQLLTNTLNRLHQSQERYREVCEAQRAVPDEDIVNTGTPTNYSPLAQHTMKDWLDAQIEVVKQRS